MTTFLQLLVILLLGLAGLIIDRTTGILIGLPLVLAYGVSRSRGVYEFVALIGLSLVGDALWQWPLGLTGMISWGLFLLSRRTALPLGLPTRAVYLICLVLGNVMLRLIYN